MKIETFEQLEGRLTAALRARTAASTVSDYEIDTALGHCILLNTSINVAEMRWALEGFVRDRLAVDDEQPGRQDGWVAVADRLPMIKPNSESSFIITVRRAHNGKSYVMVGSYLNALRLQTNDDDCPEEGSPFTGWYSLMTDDGDFDHNWSPVCSDGDEVIDWMPMLAARGEPAAASVVMDADIAAIRRTLMTGLAHNPAIHAIDRIAAGRAVALPAEPRKTLWAAVNTTTGEVDQIAEYEDGTERELVNGWEWREGVATFPPAAPAAQATLSVSSLPPPELTWLYTHCKAIGMDCKSDSGKWEHDIALFTMQLCDAAKTTTAAQAEQQSPKPAVPSDSDLIAFNGGDQFFSTSESRWGKEQNPYLQYHTGEPGYISFCRALLSQFGQAGLSLPGDAPAAQSDVKS